MNLTKEVFVVVTDPQEIASVERDGFDDILGFVSRDDGTAYAYKFSLEAWRERQKQPTTDPGVTK